MRLFESRSLREWIQPDPGETVPPANGGICAAVKLRPGPGGQMQPLCEGCCRLANNGTTGTRWDRPANGGRMPPGLSVSGSCNAVALSDATNNSSSASSASGHL